MSPIQLLNGPISNISTSSSPSPTRTKMAATSPSSSAASSSPLSQSIRRKATVVAASHSASRARRSSGTSPTTTNASTSTSPAASASASARKPTGIPSSYALSAAPAAGGGATTTNNNKTVETKRSSKRTRMVISTKKPIVSMTGTSVVGTGGGWGSGININRKSPTAQAMPSPSSSVAPASSSMAISPYSALASQCIQREEYEQAIQWYQKALKEYCHYSSSSSSSSNHHHHPSRGLQQQHQPLLMKQSQPSPRGGGGSFAGMGGRRHNNMMSSSSSSSSTTSSTTSSSASSVVSPKSAGTSASWSFSGELGIVELCNAAATCFNLGAVSKKIHQYPKAVVYYQQSERLYRQCVLMVQEQATRARQIQQEQEQLEQQLQQQQSPSKRQGKGRFSSLSITTTTTTTTTTTATLSTTPSSSATPNATATARKTSPIHNNKDKSKITAVSSSSSSSSTTSTNTTSVCLMQLIVETLQTRGHVHYKYQQSIEDAIDCHEEVVTLLDVEEDDDDDEDNEENSQDHVDGDEDHHLALVVKQGKQGNHDYVSSSDEDDDDQENNDSASESSHGRRPFRRNSSPPPPPSSSTQLAVRTQPPVTPRHAVKEEEDKVLISNIWFMASSTAIRPAIKRWELLCTSYQQLGALYLEHGDMENGISAYQEALYVLRKHLLVQEGGSSSQGGGGTPAEVPTPKQLRDRYEIMSKILCRLSELYLTRRDMDLAMDTLEDCIEIRQKQQQQETTIAVPTAGGSSSTNNNRRSSPASSSSSVCSASSATSASSVATVGVGIVDDKALSVMEQIGWANEQMGYWDKALHCYERVLLLQSQRYGPHQECVAETLVRIGRVMTCQGNPEGGLDLYQAAYAIYATHRLPLTSTNIGPSRSSSRKGSGTRMLLEEQLSSLPPLTAVPEEGSMDDDEVLEFTRHTPTTTMTTKANLLHGSSPTAANKDKTSNSMNPTLIPLDLIQMISQGYVDQGRMVEAVDFLSNAVDRQERLGPNATEEDDDDVVVEERNCHLAHLYRELGSVYLEGKDFQQASECLLESARLLEGTSNEELVFSLLQRVEFLQRKDSINDLDVVDEDEDVDDNSDEDENGTDNKEQEGAETDGHSIDLDDKYEGYAPSNYADDAKELVRELPLPQDFDEDAYSQNESSNEDEEDDDEDYDDLNEKTAYSKDQRTALISHQIDGITGEDRLSPLAYHPDGLPEDRLASSSPKLAVTGERSTAAHQQVMVEDSILAAAENGQPADTNRVSNIMANPSISSASTSNRSEGSTDDSSMRASPASTTAVLVDPVPKSPPHLASAIEEGVLNTSNANSVISQDPFFGEAMSEMPSPIRNRRDDDEEDDDGGDDDDDDEDSLGSDRHLGITTPFTFNLLEKDQQLQVEKGLATALGAWPIPGEEIVPVLPILPGGPSLSEPNYGDQTSKASKEGIPNENGSRSTQSTVTSVETASPVTSDRGIVPDSPKGEPCGTDTILKDLLVADRMKIPNANPSYPSQTLVAPRSPTRARPDAGGHLALSNHKPSEASFPAARTNESRPFDDSSRHSDDDVSRASGLNSKLGSHETDDSLPSHYFNVGEKPVPISPSGHLVTDEEKNTLEQDRSSDHASPQNEEGEKRSSIPALQGPEENSPPFRSISPAETATSRTGLLNQEVKEGLFQPVLANKSPRVPAISPRQQKKEKKAYTEMNYVPKSSSRNRFVKAISSPFRRATRKRGTTSGPTLGALDEEKETHIIPKTSQPLTPQSLTPPKQRPLLQTDDNELNTIPVDAPISYISMNSPSFEDDAVSQMSQITFQFEEPMSRQGDQEGQWWWGVRAEKLEGWFPTTYVSQAVEAAEGFLSAKSIHDLVKSRPLDFDSDEESEVDETDELSKPVEDGKTGPVDLDATTTSNNSKFSRQDDVAGPSTNERKVSNESSETNPPSTKNTSGASLGNKMDRGQSLKAEIVEHQEILKKQKKEYGQEHGTVAATLFTLSVLHSKNRNLEATMNCAMEALQIQKAIGNLPDAARSLHFLADLHASQRKYNSALSYYREAKRLQEATFGLYHEEIANTLNRIGNVLARQGDFAQAMEQHHAALMILKECFGEDVKHPLVSQTLIQIGAVYYKERNSLATIQANVDDRAYSTFIEGGMLEVIGRAHEDRGSYRMALAFFEEKLQFLDGRPDSNELDVVAETLNSLGMLSTRAGLYMEAIDYYDRALSIQMKLGCDEVQLAMARVLTGSVQYHLGQFRKALKLFQDALTILKKHVGREHETVAATLFQMGVARAALCEYDSAMTCLHEALEIQDSKLGADHPATLRTRREIGNNYAIYKAELPSAFEHFYDVLERQKRIHGEKHPNIAETLHSIGKAQARDGNYQLALKTLEDCYNMRLEFLGMDHPSQATTLHEIAKIQLDRGRLKKAIHICDAALQIRLETLSENHIDVALVMATKASCLVAKGSFVDANKLFLQVLPIAEAAVGPGQHPSLADIHIQMGDMHLRKCHFEEATESIQKALDMYRKCNLDEDHPGIKQALADLERVERSEMLCV